MSTEIEWDWRSGLYLLSSLLGVFSLASAAVEPIRVIAEGGSESAFRTAATFLLAASFACKIPYLSSKGAALAVRFLYFWAIGWAAVSIIMFVAMRG